MGTTTRQIEAHIDRTREAFGANLDELEQKVKDATDWRHQFRTKPKTLLGIAFGGGVVLSAIVGGRNSRGTKPLQSKSSAGANPGVKSDSREEVAARQTWDNVKGAIIAVATTRLLSYAGEVFPSFLKKSEPMDKTSGASSPLGE